MDKRVEKTKYAIKNAFLKLRKKKPLEKITVKELCEKAYINKSTFYAHYEDIYALSDALEYELVLEVVSSIPQNVDYNFTNPEVFTREVTLAFARYLPQVKLLFSGKSRTHLAIYLEEIIKSQIFAKYPEAAKNEEMNIMLSYCIHGALNASLSNPDADPKTILKVLDKVTKALQPLF